MTTPADSPREHLAWLIWCYGQGYNAVDRASIPNWMGDDPATLTDDDIRTQRELLASADEILALLARDTGGVMSEAGGGLTYPDSAGGETCGGCTCCTVAGCIPSQCGEDEYGRFHCPCTSE